MDYFMTMTIYDYDYFMTMTIFWWLFWWLWMSMGRKGNLAVFESSNISGTEEAMPTKIGLHACDINPYLHKFFEPIPID